MDVLVYKAVREVLIELWTLNQELLPLNCPVFVDYRCTGSYDLVSEFFLFIMGLGLLCLHAEWLGRRLTGRIFCDWCRRRGLRWMRLESSYVAFSGGGTELRLICIA